MRRAVVCSLVVASAVAGGGVVFSRGGDVGADAGNAGRGGGAAPAAGHSAEATSRPAAPSQAVASAWRLPRPSPMPRDYDVLLRRSIFGQGKSAPAGRDAPAVEARWVLRGVLLQEGRFTAFLEDLSGRTLRGLRAGDAVARGRLESVSFDGLAYEADGVLTHVDIGQDLSGRAAPLPTTSPARAPAGREDREDKGDRDDKGERKDRQVDGDSAGRRRREQ